MLHFLPKRYNKGTLYINQISGMEENEWRKS
jgi:hypothetical protein